jgi:uncharacterized protein (TIGR02145 family)
MNTGIRIFIHLALMTGILVVILTGCKKEKDIPETVTDFDGNIYQTVTIGDQVWLVENFMSTRYNDGTSIPLVTINTDWINLSAPGYCWYDNDIANRETYGALFNWYAVQTNKLCPTGWHVPSDEEWTTLTDFLGGESTVGGKLKEAGTSHWDSPNIGATNESGFTALPGGFRGAQGVCYYIGHWGQFWTSTSPVETVAYYRQMAADSEGVDNGKGNAIQRLCGLSVRCVMN